MMEDTRDELNGPEDLDTAMEHHRSGRYFQAKAIYKKILDRTPDHPDALHLLGVMAIQEADYPLAIRLIAAAINLRPDDPVFFCNLASALHSAQKFEDAVAMYQHALQLKPDYPDAYFNLGNTLQIMGELDLALEIYRQALLLKPDYFEAMHRIACVMHTWGKTDEAETWCRYSLEVNPGYPEALFMLGQCLFKQDRVSEALECFLNHKKAVAANSPAVASKQLAYLLLPLQKVKDWCNTGQGKYHAVLPAAKFHIPAPEILNDDGGTLQLSAGDAELSEIYLAEVTQASVLGWHDVVLVNERQAALYDLAANDIAGNIESEHWTISYLSSRQILISGFSEGGSSIDHAIMFAGRGKDSYAHWVIDFLSKCYVLEKFSEYRDWPLIIDEGLYPQQVEALQYLAGGRQLIPIRHNNIYDVGRLVMISDMSHMRMQSYRPNTLPSWNEAPVSPHGISYLRERLGVPVKRSATGKLLYVSRKYQTSFRQLVNEEQVEALFASYGFEIVYPERLGFFEQVRLFSSARAIAGCGGSNLINMIFAPADIRILLLARSSPKINYYFFTHLAETIGQELFYVLGETVAHNAVHYQSDFSVKIEKVEAGIQRLLA
jgi:capsular polysaccharide biosynthesis protein/Flp pilus assembly protein TadD